ncbi:MAG: heme exporter protein CcmD [Gammaproteobacteria bacterium]|nr:heme exporter protein CcmD [Gammaproteobacteria bacterium]
MAEFLAMGGYAEFVWSTFGLTAVVLIINVVTARRRMRLALDELQMKLMRERQRSAPQ